MRKHEIDSIQELNYEELANILGGEEAAKVCGCVCVGELEEAEMEEMEDAAGADPGNTNKNGRKSKRNS